MTDHIQERAEKAAREIIKSHETDFAWGVGRSICLEGEELDELEQQIAAAIRSAIDQNNIDWTHVDPREKEREALRARVAELEKERDAAKNLLAVLHRDGGHHTEAVGFFQSCLDGENVWRVLIQRAESAEARVKELEEELEHPSDITNLLRAVPIAAEQLAAAQSRILALEGALREFQEKRGRHEGAHDSEGGTSCSRCYASYVEEEAKLDQALAGATEEI